MSHFRYQVSFRVRHPRMDPGEISVRLSLAPVISWMAGDVRKSPKGTPLDGRRGATYWSHTLKESEGKRLADSLEHFTTRLEPHREFLLELSSTGGACEYFVGWFSD